MLDVTRKDVHAANNVFKTIKFKGQRLSLMYEQGKSFTQFEEERISEM